MKYLLIVYCMSSAIGYAAASDSPKKTSRRRSSKSVVVPSDKQYSPVSSPLASPKDKVMLMQKLSEQSQKTVNVREQNPHVLPLSSVLQTVNVREQSPHVLPLSSVLPRSKSNPEQLAGSLMLLDEVAEAYREAPVTPGRARKGSLLSGRTSSISIDLQEVSNPDPEVVLSPRRDVPPSPRSTLSPRALVRVASLNTCGKAMDAVDEREKRKQVYRDQLQPGERRIFDVVGLKNLEFIRKQPNLLQILSDVHDDEIDSWYKAYLRSTILILQQKLDGKRAAIKSLDSRLVADSPRDDSPDAVVRLIQEEHKDDLSPRKDVMNKSRDGVRDRIKLHLAVAREEANFLIGAPKSVEDMASCRIAESSTSSPSTSNS